jgi:HEAT repeat protein
MAAARALGRIGAAADIPALVELLKDPVWWVRYHAAQAVAGLKGMTPEELQVVRETARDHFAADMLAHALAELPIRRRKIFG